MRTIIIRHCETDWNARGLIQGTTDNPLNARGRRQAVRLARRIAGEPIELVVCSDLLRAVQTAEAVAATLGRPLRIDPRLRECSFGSLEGLPFAEFTLRAGPKNTSVWPDPLESDFTPFGGDAARDVFSRQKALLDELRDAGHSTVAIVGHGRALRTLLAPLGVHVVRMRNGEHIVIDH